MKTPQSPWVQIRAVGVDQSLPVSLSRSRVEPAWEKSRHELRETGKKQTIGDKKKQKQLTRNVLGFLLSSQTFLKMHIKIPLKSSTQGWAQRVKPSLCKTEDLNSSPRSHLKVERENGLQKLSSDLCMCTVAHMHPTHTNILKNP